MAMCVSGEKLLQEVTGICSGQVYPVTTTQSMMNTDMAILLQGRSNNEI